ncbi:uncharacterized protein BO97DRAFT_438879 [Aspergillus homomorphus CBS 101889]|uniref:Nephrocystin 3-like N-terminal domain-containing protein n=1 Tax=Aspergillus homomorphus (strain CBS 101889) TaxID=1450537 RepID=A0A395HG81_ASPHC|nr:hypothetical protein BO97DRAFT_438879 [Aspergillus homomorphus CBS 101889]RAL06857.1 hypothetical protein BO97DRAFT_438879 [Aspergillus homomorphus CBS 101889]
MSFGFGVGIPGQQTPLVEYCENEETRTILTWLSPISHAPQHSDYRDRREPGTGKWALATPEFRSWLMSPKQTLYCPGAPGAGKTILAPIVVDELFLRYRSSDNVGIAYVYCNYKRQQEQQSAQILASLIQQLAYRKPSSLETIKFEQIFIVIDALDEFQMQDGSRNRVLHEISAIQVSHNVNLPATSRDIPDATALFNGQPVLEINAREEDIVKYLKSHMIRLPSFVEKIAQGA